MSKTYTYDKSNEYLKRALNVIPGGVYGHLGPAEGCFIPVSAFPKFCSKADGAYFWDVDGNKFIDYMCAYGPNILGYNDKDVDGAAFEQSKIANCTTSPGTVMIEFAELLTKTTRKDWAFFGKNGNDMTQFAMMISRAYTKRKKIILFEGYYHGVSPWQSKKDVPGAIEEDVANTIVIPWNDIDALKATVAKYKGQIAAVMSTPYMHGNFVDNVLPIQGFWKEVRKICTENQIILVFDDVRCGFRLDVRGSDFYYGIEADLICFCKALANGWSISSLCGKDFLKATATDIPYTGSYWLSSIPIAAAKACIEKIIKTDATNIMMEKGRKLCDGLKAVAKKNKVNLIVSGEPSLFYLRIANDDSLFLHQEWIASMVKRGIFLTNHHNHFINYALSDEDIEKTIKVADETLQLLVKNHPEVKWQ